MGWFVGGDHQCHSIDDLNELFHYIFIGCSSWTRGSLRFRVQVTRGVNLPTLWCCPQDASGPLDNGALRWWND